MADALDRSYGAPLRGPLPLGNKEDPLDELVYILLTVMTQYGVHDTFARLRARFSEWSDVAGAPRDELAAVLQPIGLSKQRANRIVALLQEIREREGLVSLERLRRLDDAHVEAYLTSLPGVGKKVARCVMLYSLGRDVFPVDAHVLRVLKRLMLVDPDVTLSRAQDLAQEQTPDLLRYTLHVNLVVHGRAVCRARQPRCGDCGLESQCPSSSYRKAST